MPSGAQIQVWVVLQMLVAERGSQTRQRLRACRCAHTGAVPVNKP